jgi:hypothetical protein
MIITYNEYRSTENLRAECYWNRAIHLGITKKYINYFQRITTDSFGAI